MGPHATWDRFQGRELEGGDLQLYLPHQDTNRDGTNTELWFEGDVIRADLSINLSTDTTVLFANYGVGERVDLGVAEPFRQVDLSATILTSIERLATGDDPFVVHQFEGGGTDSTFQESGSASGIGTCSPRSASGLTPSDGCSSWATCSSRSATTAFRTR